MNLAPARPHEITRYRRQIESVGRQLNDPGVYERAREACLNQQAFLFVCGRNFLVLVPERRSGLPGVRVWLAHGRAHERRAYIEELERLAREIGGQFLIFGTARKGFDRVAPRLGFVPEQSAFNGTRITQWVKMYGQQ